MYTFTKKLPALLLCLSLGTSFAATTTGAGLLNSDFTWLRLFGMWHDQFTPKGWGLGAGAKIDPTPHVTLAADLEIRLLRSNLNDDASTISNATGVVVPVTLQYTLLADHYSTFQPFMLGGGYYTSNDIGGAEFGWLVGGGIGFCLGTEVLSLDFRYYSDTFITDSPDVHHYGARLTLWFQKPEARSTGSTRSTTTRSTSTGGTTSRPGTTTSGGKTRY